MSQNGVSAGPPDTDALVARARLMMIISALTTLIAIAAVLSVVGYRVFSGPNSAIGSDGVVTLPKGARVLATAASGGRLAVLLDMGGTSELRTFDIKTLKQTGRLQFAPQP